MEYAHYKCKLLFIIIIIINRLPWEYILYTYTNEHNSSLRSEHAPVSLFFLEKKISLPSICDPHVILPNVSLSLA